MEQYNETNYRRTKQRDIILKVLTDTKSHPTAEWIFNAVRKELSSISLGTVYRNLRHLISIGKVVEYNCQGDTSRFDANINRHYHVTCCKCKKMIDIEPGYIPKTELDHLKQIKKIVEAKTSFQINAQCMGFYGTCHECRQAS